MNNIDFDKIQKEIEDGYINVQTHPNGKLRIFNYSNKAQFDNHWTEETMLCRGLIVDQDNKVIARPFSKFFSYDQLEGIVPNEPFKVFDKMDGSLGILYWIDNEPSIATRGSFISEQATKATQIFRDKYINCNWRMDKTYLFEIIYPENRIVIDYGNKEDLILLAIIDIKLGVEERIISHLIGNISIVQQHYNLENLGAILNIQESNKEGFVLLFESGQRVKIKFNEYKRLHRLLTGISVRHIWECLRFGDGLENLIEKVPDEFYKWVKQIECDLNKKFKIIESKAKEQYKILESRKETALYFQQCEYPSVMFWMLDNKDYSDIIWKMIRPINEGVFKCDSL